MIKELKSNYEKTLIENENLIKINLNLENDLNRLVKDFHSNIDKAVRKTEHDKNLLLSKQTSYESVIKRLTLLYNSQQKKLESIVSLFKYNNFNF